MEDKENAFRPHPAKFVKGMRNCEYLVDNCNFQYILSKVSVTGAKFYVCTKKRDGCKGRATVKDGMIVGLFLHNDHDSNPIAIDVLKKKEAMLEAVKANPNIKTDTLVTNFLKATGREEASGGQKKTLQRSIQRAKAAIMKRPPLPKGLEDLEQLPDSHSITYDDERFLLTNFMNNGKRNLVFASGRGIDLLRHATSLSGDGTFDIPPKMFYQVYLILAELDGVSYPAVFCLLGDKKSSTYKLMFQAIRQAMLKPLPEDSPLPHAPGSFNIDFEVGCINQFKAVFPEVKEIRGCLVHFKRNMAKKRKELGYLSTWYQKSKLFHLFVNCLYNLTYVPLDMVTTYYEALLKEVLPEVCSEIDSYVCEESEVDAKGKPFSMDDEEKFELRDEINKYLLYIEANYVGGKTRTGYSSPKFPLAIWNHHQTALEMGQTTTNRNEGRNMNLRAAIPINAGIWQVIEGFKDLEAKAHATRNEDIARLPLGGRPISQLTGDILGPASNRERQRSIKAFELKNIVEHRLQYGPVAYLKLLSQEKTA